jgi:hypothetical protein
LHATGGCDQKAGYQGGEGIATFESLKVQKATEEEELYLSALREEGAATVESLEVQQAIEEEELYLSALKRRI